jgi:hypothetical protein
MAMNSCLYQRQILRDRRLGMTACPASEWWGQMKWNTRTSTTSPTNQPRKDPFHKYSLSYPFNSQQGHPSLVWSLPRILQNGVFFPIFNISGFLYKIYIFHSLKLEFRSTFLFMEHWSSLMWFLSFLSMYFCKYCKDDADSAKEHRIRNMVSKLRILINDQWVFQLLPMAHLGLNPTFIIFRNYWSRKVPESPPQRRIEGRRPKGNLYVLPVTNFAKTMLINEEESYLNVVIYLYYLNNADGRRGKLQLPPHHQHPYKFLDDSFFSGFIYVGFSWCVHTMGNLLFSNIRKKDTWQCGAPRISNWSIVIRGNNKNNDDGDPWDLPESLFATFCILYRILCCTQRCTNLFKKVHSISPKTKYVTIIS